MMRNLFAITLFALAASCAAQQQMPSWNDHLGAVTPGDHGARPENSGQLLVEQEGCGGGAACTVSVYTKEGAPVQQLEGNGRWVEGSLRAGKYIVVAEWDKQLRRVQVIVSPRQKTAVNASDLQQAPVVH